MEERLSSHASFWEERFVSSPGMFGEAPNEFVAAHASWIPEGAEVLELGAGEGRNAVYLARERGCRLTAVDFSDTALQTAEELAGESEVSINTKKVDLRRWKAERTSWDALVMTFVQLLPDERERLYVEIKKALRPGGIFIGEWFRPEHLEDPFARIGPSSADRLVSASELKAHFADGIIQCTEVDVHLDEGTMLQGRAALSRLIYQNSED